MRLDRKLAIVTGGASGLGEAMVRRFVDEGANVVVADIDEKAGQNLASELGNTCQFIRLDVSQEQDWQHIMAKFDRVDILVNNAGITTFGNIEAVTLEQFKHEFEIDVVGVFLGCKHVIPSMKQHGGSIINIASMCAVRAQPDLVAYNGAKAAVTHMTRSVALHCAREKYGIRCNAILPGIIKTPILQKVLDQMENSKALFDEWVSDHPVGRLGEPEEIAEMAVYLASDQSKFTTGTEMRIDGGSSL